VRFYAPDSRKLTSFYWCIHKGRAYAAYVNAPSDDKFTPQNYAPEDVVDEGSRVPQLLLTLRGKDTTLYERNTA